MSAIRNRLMEIIKANKNMVSKFDLSLDTLKTITLKNGWNMQQGIHMQTELNLATDNAASFDMETKTFTIDLSDKFQKYRGVPSEICYPVYNDYEYGDSWMIGECEKTGKPSVYLVTGETKVKIIPESLMKLDNNLFVKHDISNALSLLFPELNQCGCE